jgi:hypothetical protein
MLFLFVYAFAFVLLVACWLVGDMEGRTKVIYTLVYLATWALMFWTPYAVIATQAFFIIVLGLAAFGPEFFGGRRR